MARVLIKAMIFLDPTFSKLEQQLSIERFAALGLCTTLWSWCLTFAEDGDLSRFDSEALAAAIGWKGDPDALVEALIAARVIERTEHGLTVHDWHPIP